MNSLSDPDSGPRAAEPTIYDVAARAGVSIATVSHALNRPERVSEATRQRVLDSAALLGFVPRGRGRGSRVRSLRRVGVSAPFDAHPTYVSRLMGVLDVLAPKVDVLVVDDSRGPGAPEIDRIALHSPVDGLVIMGSEPTPRLADELDQAGIPVVVLDRPTSRYTNVTVSDETGGRLVADHLLGAGVHRPAWVSPAPVTGTHVTNGELRLRGFTQQLRDHGHDQEVAWIVCVDDSFEAGRSAALELTSDGAGVPLPDAAFVLHDVLAAGFVAGLRQNGIRVPEDIRVVGYDDVQASELFDLTTVRQPFRESGATAADALRVLHDHPGRPPARISLDPELVLRGSSPR